MQNPLISVIIPNYNHAQYLNQRIDSVLAQTYQNFELIILDDCSPDEGASRKVIEQYRDNPHVSHIVYNEINSGSTFRQWDKGISLAKGELIWIAESDDFCEPNLLEVLVHEFERDEQLTLSCVLLQTVNQDGKKMGTLSFHPWWNIRIDGKKFATHYMTHGSMLANASGILFKKSSALMANPIYKSYKASGDYIFWLQIVLMGNVAIISQRLNYFRQHQVKVTGNSSRKGINMRECFDSIQFVYSILPMSEYRKRLVEEFHVYQVHTMKFENEEIRRNLICDYNLPTKLSIRIRLKFKLILILQHRLGLYL